jgi:hypothetical protein
MNCPKCNSEKIRRSRRRGLYETLVLRYMHAEPFRCEACGMRFSVSAADKGSPDTVSRPHQPHNPHNPQNQPQPHPLPQNPRRHRSILSKMGLRGSRRKRVARDLKFVVILLVCCIAVIGLVLHTSSEQPSSPQSLGSE